MPFPPPSSFVSTTSFYASFVTTIEDSNTLTTEPSVLGPNNEEIVAFEHVVNDEALDVDFTDVFTTQECFISRDKLIEWVQARGREHGIVIIIGRSDSGAGKKRARLLLICERSGVYKENVKIGSLSLRIDKEEKVENVDDVVGKGKRKRETGTKKCGCPFRLRGKQVSIDEWALEVECGKHNHPTADHMEGHSYIGRLQKSEETFVIDFSKGNTKPKDILFGLKQRFEGNKSTIKTIYNARTKNRVKERDGRSEMQQLIFKLKEHGYTFYDTRCESTNIVKNLFWAHPKSIDLMRCFPKVIFMDCTYKTNRYKLPLLEIVGVTSTQITFLIAVAILEFEREENYTWALSILKSLMHECSLPTVILTDREKALMNAIEKTFPTSINFLCRWHINRNVLANCKKLLGQKKKWDAFNLHWNVLVISATETEFEEGLKRLQSLFKDSMPAVNYVMEQWLLPYKERFVAFWTDNVMHYDNNTTNRVPSRTIIVLGVK